MDFILVAFKFLWSLRNKQFVDMFVYLDVYGSWPERMCIRGNKKKLNKLQQSVSGQDKKKTTTKQHKVTPLGSLILWIILSTSAHSRDEEKLYAGLDLGFLLENFNFMDGREIEKI